MQPRHWYCRFVFLLQCGRFQNTLVEFYCKPLLPIFIINWTGKDHLCIFFEDLKIYNFFKVV